MEVVRLGRTATLSRKLINHGGHRASPRPIATQQCASTGMTPRRMWRGSLLRLGGATACYLSRSANMLPGPPPRRRSGGAHPSPRHRRTTTATMSTRATAPRANGAKRPCRWIALLLTLGAFTTCTAMFTNGRRTADTPAALTGVQDQQMNVASGLFAAVAGATLPSSSAPRIEKPYSHTPAPTAAAFVLPERLPLDRIGQRSDLRSASISPLSGSSTRLLRGSCVPREAIRHLEERGDERHDQGHQPLDIREAWRVVLVWQKPVLEAIEGALAPVRTASHKASGSTPALIPIEKASATTIWIP